jgi:hypothetical protein
LVDPANLQCFSQPHWLVIARGLDTEKWFEEGVGAGTGGIVMPKPADLPVGQRYYRFASSTSSHSAQVGGGWWIDYENYRKIATFARDHGHALPYAARLFLALPVPWTRVDRLVSAILQTPLRAYAGRGGVAAGGGDRWTPVQHDPVIQFYIPGLYVKGANPQLHETAFPNPKIEFTANM